MSTPFKVLLAIVGWVTFVTLMHLWLNTTMLDFGSAGKRAVHHFKVGFLPVT